MDDIENKYKPFPFWSWNDKLEEKELIHQIDWMNENGIGGFFMHARGGLKTDYLSTEWFDAIKVCLKRAKELNMEAYAYDENGWPSGFAGGKLLEDIENHDMMITYKIGEYDKSAAVSYDISGNNLIRVTSGNNVMNIYLSNSTCTADVLNKKVVDQFIKLTHEEYKKNDIYGNLRGFFTDEPQYFRWKTAYTRVLPEYFKKHYNEDIFDRIGLLFVEKDGYRDFRYKYWKAMQDLMLTNYAKNLYDWCDKNGYIFTGHYIEENAISTQMWCCAGIMPMYEYEHIPGIDYLGRNLNRTPGPKQLGSVAEQLNKPQRMAEIFACSGWDATPNELKVLAEYAMVGGVNILCHHLLPYSEHGQRKRDYPEHFSIVNPWVNKGFKQFNDYFSTIGKLLSTSKEIVNVAVLHPIRSAYLDYKFDEVDNWSRNLSKLDQSFLEDHRFFEINQLAWHYLDETILAKHGKVDGKTLNVGQCSYNFIIIPRNVTTMDKSTEKLLHEYVDNGGKIMLLGDKPTFIEGEEYNYDYLKSNTNIDEICSSLDINVEKHDDVVCSYHKTSNGDEYVYLVNLGEKTSIKVSKKGFKNLKINEIVCSNVVCLDKYESKIVYFTNDEANKVENKNVLKLDNKFNISKIEKNFINLDFISYSKDNKNYSKKYHSMFIFETLIKEKYEGDLYLKYNVDIHKVPSICFALIEDTDTKEVYINGHLVNKVGYVIEKDLWKYDIVKYLKEGNNEIITKLYFHEKKEVFEAIYGENVTESLKNCLAYDTTIEPIILEGDFGVYGDFSEVNNFYIANTLYLDKQKENITTLVTDGFPFFRGDIKLTQKINVKDTSLIFEVDKRFQMIEIYINGKYVDTLLLKTKTDLSKFLKIGENEISLVVTISNRNLLGPHHLHVEESFGVGPDTFERFKTWKEDGTSPTLKTRYSFVKVI